VSEKKVEISVVLTAIDRMSSVIQKATAANSKKYGEMSSKAFAMGRTAAVGAGLLAAPLVMATKAAIDFEDKMADVAKVMNLSVGSAEFNKMGSAAKFLGKEMAIGAEGAAGLMASLAQGGVAKQNITEVARISGKMGVAFGMGAEEAGEKFIKMSNAMGTTIPQTKRVADAINYLSDNTASKASEITTYMAQAGALITKGLGISGAASAAFGASLISMGISAEESATTMARLQKGIMQSPEMFRKFTDAGGGVKGIMKILADGSTLSSEAQAKYFQNFGEYGNKIRLMSQSYNNTAKTIGLVSKEQNYLNSVQKEFANRSSTTKFKLDQAKAAFQNAAISVGNSLLPVVTRLLNAINPIIERVSKWIERNPELTATITKVVAVSAAMLAAISGVSFAVGGVMKVISAANSLMGFAAKAIGWVSTAFRVLSAVMLSNPIILIVTAIVAAIAGAAFLIYKYWDNIKKFFINLWTNIKMVFWKVVDWVKKWGLLFVNPIGFIIQHWDKIVMYFKMFAPKMVAAGKAIIQGLWDGIKSMAGNVLNFITNLANNIWKKFKGVLGIASPSRVFIEMGRNVSAGAALGIAAATPMAVNASANLATKIIKAPEKTRSISTPRARGNTGSSFTYAPVINAQGAASGVEANIKKMLQENAKEIYKIVTAQKAKEKMTDFK